jgi:hypothetical protein
MGRSCWTSVGLPNWSGLEAVGAAPRGLDPLLGRDRLPQTGHNLTATKRMTARVCRASPAGVA